MWNKNYHIVRKLASMSHVSALIDAQSTRKKHALSQLAKQKDITKSNSYAVLLALKDNIGYPARLVRVRLPE